MKIRSDLICSVSLDHCAEFQPSCGVSVGRLRALYFVFFVFCFLSKLLLFVLIPSQGAAMARPGTEGVFTRVELKIGFHSTTQCLLFYLVPVFEAHSVQFTGVVSLGDLVIKVTRLLCQE